LQPTRIVLAGLSGLLHDIVADALTGQSDIVVVADYGDSASSDRAFANDTTQTDVVLLGREPTMSELEVVSGCLEITVLALTDDGRSAYRYALRPERIPLGTWTGISPQSLIDAIRAAPKRGAGA
jgi:hypothetical protein